MKKYIILISIFLGLFQINLSFAENPDYVDYVISKTNSTYYELNKYGEFFDETGIKKRISSYSCYNINPLTYYRFRAKRYILHINDTYCYTKELNAEKKILYKDIGKYFTVLNYSLPIKLESNFYYAYKYDKYYYFDDTEGYYESDFNKLGYDKNTSIVLKNGDKYVFVKDYQKIKLFDKLLISEIKNKVKFMQTIYDDIKKSDTNSDDIQTSLQAMKNFSKTIKTQESDTKIKTIYKYLIDNTSYYTGSLSGNLDGLPIFSGIYTYKNKIGVCDGYVKEMAYLLMFAGFENFTIKRGFVIDSELFPDIGHAWIKIGNYYYDPTFEDPLGQNHVRLEKDYKFYKLAKSILYADRFEAESTKDIPNELLFLDKTKREIFVEKRYFDLASNGVYKDYLLMRPYVNKLSLGLNQTTKLDLEKAKNLLNYIEVDDFRVYDSLGNKKYIKDIMYYKVDNTNIDDLMKSVYLYDKTGVYLLKWKLKNGIYEYRLASNIIYY